MSVDRSKFVWTATSSRKYALLQQYWKIELLFLISITILKTIYHVSLLTRPGVCNTVVNKRQGIITGQITEQLTTGKTPWQFSSSSLV